MRRIKSIVIAVAVGVILMTGMAHATPLSLDYGRPIIMIDGTGDANTSVGILVTDGLIGYQFGYFLNNDYSSFNLISTAVANVFFNDGDIVDYAFYNGSADKYYTLIGDYADPSYSVKMEYIQELDASKAEDQALIARYGIDSYYKTVGLTWQLPDALSYNISFALNDINDGQHPAVPEPGTFLLLGSGLIGVMVYRRNKR